TVENMADPATSKIPDWEHPEFPELIDRIIAAREKGNPVIWSLGAHVIKCGLSRYLIELMEAGYVSHLAGNGAVSIHDFEISYLGGTSEYVPHAIEDGSFGMWEETGLWMNEALKQGYEKGLGYGASLAEYMDSNPGRFPHRQDSVVYQAYKRGISATFHVTIGTDIIDEHPAADFSAKGGTSGRDFAIYCHSISQLEGGVFLNFGSAVTGPEVFLKALAICRNQGYKLQEITTANFDLIPLGKDYRKEIGKDDYNYFYRPRKNIINRPTSLGGKGFYIRGNHKKTIPNMYSELKKRS
ncbi:MAG: hypothetical protein ACOCQH_01825, partial [Halanaerobiales bacterium]